MNKKGFTLIELLVTISLIAILSLISFVSINAVIKQNKINNCNTLVNSIKSATSEYVSDNRYKSTFVSSVTDYTLAINASTLVNGNYLKGQIINPFTKEDISPDSILISIELNSDYTLKKASISAPAVLLNCNG